MLGEKERMWQAHVWLGDWLHWVNWSSQLGNILRILTVWFLIVEEGIYNYGKVGKIEKALGHWIGIGNMGLNLCFKTWYMDKNTDNNHSYRCLCACMYICTHVYTCVCVCVWCVCVYVCVWCVCVYTHCLLRRLGSNDTQAVISSPNSPSLISKYYSSLKETEVPCWSG